MTRKEKAQAIIDNGEYIIPPCNLLETAPQDETSIYYMQEKELDAMLPTTEEPAQEQTEQSNANSAEEKEGEKTMESTIKCTYEEKTRNGYKVTWETTDAEQVYSDLSHELISKKINACTYIRSIKRTPLYNGTQKITVTYDHGGRRTYIVSDH